MGFTLIKIFISAAVIAFASWLSGKRPELAGFIAAMPLLTLLVLAFSFAEYRDAATSVRFAKSIFLAVPVSLLFFVPFLLSEKWNLSFWQCYGLGILLLILGYILHSRLMQWL